MTKPRIADTRPMPIELKTGDTVYWCSRGRSKTQPFCDGSHKGTGMSPQAFKAEESGEAHLYQCKQTGNPPYCDGTHSKL